MKQIACPECGGPNVNHYTDGYLLRTPVIKEDGSLGLIDCDTLEYEEFFQCCDCGHRPGEAELISAAVEAGASRGACSFTNAPNARATAPHS
jgi:hypothetical protein